MPKGASKNENPISLNLNHAAAPHRDPIPGQKREERKLHLLREAQIVFGPFRAVHHPRDGFGSIEWSIVVVVIVPTFSRCLWVCVCYANEIDTELARIKLTPSSRA